MSAGKPHSLRDDGPHRSPVNPADQTLGGGHGIRREDFFGLTLTFTRQDGDGAEALMRRCAAILSAPGTRAGAGSEVRVF